MTEPTTDNSVTGNTANPGPGLDSQIYDTDGKLWKDKFHGRGGIIDQLKREHAERAGALEQAVSQREAQVTQHQARLAILEQSLNDARSQAASLPELQQKATEAEGLRQQLEALTSQVGEVDMLKKRAGLAGRYRLAMDFPGLLALRVEQKEKAEDGTETVTGYTNPILALIENSAMPDEELKKALDDLASVMPKGDGRPMPPLSTNTIQPPSPKPSTDNDAESWQKKMQEAQRQYQETGDAAFWRDFDAASEKYHALTDK